MPLKSDLPPHEAQALARKRLVQTCHDMLDGRLTFLEGTIMICSLRFDLGIQERDPDIIVFVGIDSQTDYLPPDHTHHLWDSNALKRLQPEFEREEAWAREYGTPACENLIRRFSQETGESAGNSIS